MLHTLNIASWEETHSSDLQATAMKALEQGKILYLPSLSFELSALEVPLLNMHYTESKAKNISFLPHKNQLNGSEFKLASRDRLAGMMKRYSETARQFLTNLIPYYQPHLIVGRTSFRPIEIKGRKTSIRKDDTRLHVDAFTSSPTQGKRILRIFSNIHPHQDRVWQTGEPFDNMLAKLATKLNSPLPGLRRLLSLLNITKTYRTLYDHYMLQLHNLMKESNDYQQNVTKQEIRFPPRSSWIVMTDYVSHAALSGQHVLEQTFYLPADKMFLPHLSPQKTLERLFAQPLV